jgi:hypothetical protein
MFVKVVINTTKSLPFSERRDREGVFEVVEKYAPGNEYGPSAR